MMTAAHLPRYFVLIVGNRPFTSSLAPDQPIIFHNESSAVSALDRLDLSTWPGSVMLEWYADDLSFLGSRPLPRLSATLGNT